MPGAPDTRPPATQAELDAAVSALSGRPIAALTGVGFSTDSGLPDYRGPDALPRRPMTSSSHALATQPHQNAKMMTAR